VSTGHKNKGLALLNKLFAKLPSDEYELGIVGYPAVKPKYNNIKYIGYIKDPKALNELYAAADYTIHPSTYDAFGQIITESLYSGTPVIISKNVGAKEIVKKEYGTIVDNFEINTWLDLLKNIDQEAFEIPENIDDFLQLNLNNHMEVILNQKF
jgi:glycosyltransferase involved in cell wall biosynthesis